MDRSKVIKVTSFLLLIVGVCLFFHFELHQYLTLAKIKELRGSWQDIYSTEPIKVIAIYFGIYMFSVACSIPGAAVLTLLAGALFGFGAGLLIVSFASSIGATMSMLASRYFFADLVNAKFPKVIGKINDGLAEEGSLYLFGLRLAPIIPFFLINLAFGVTKFSARKFYIISQVGMLPGTAVYVFAGKSLGSISSLSGILSTNTILAFTLLAIFPLIISKVMKIVRDKKSA